MTKITDTSAVSLLACDEGFDPIEDRLRANIRGTIEAVFNEECAHRGHPVRHFDNIRSVIPI